MFETRQQMLHRYRNVRYRIILLGGGETSSPIIPPDEIAGLVGWFDASDASTIVVNDPQDNKFKWANKSQDANAIATLASDEGLPTVGVIQNKSAIFHELDDARVRGALGTPLRDMTWFMRMAFLNPIDSSFGLLYEGQNTGMFECDLGVTSAANRLSNSTNAGTLYVDDQSITKAAGIQITAGEAYNLISSGYAEEEWRTVGFRLENNTQFQELNTALAGRAGGEGTKNNPAKAIGEILVYDSALSDAQVTQVLAYLEDKWPNSSAPDGFTELTGEDGTQLTSEDNTILVVVE